MPASLLFISPRRAILFCLLLSLFELLTYVGSDFIMPGMLDIITELNADPRYVPFSLNAYLLGGVAFQWLIGPLSDRFGRRPLLLTGCALFALTCLATLWIKEVNLFTLLRFFQGIGLGFVVVVSYPALQESFSEADAVRLIAIVGNIALLSPLLGPLVGSVLLSVMEWRAMFITIALLSMLVWLGLYWLMPETVGVPRREGGTIAPTPLRLQDLRNDYLNLLRNQRFIAGCLALGLTGLPLLSWIALSPLLLMHNLGLSTYAYALWQLPVFGALIFGNFALNTLIKHFSIEQLLRISLLPMLAGMVLGLIFTSITAHILALIGGLAVYAFGLGIGNATLYRLTLYSSESGKGCVSAMLGMISVAIYGLGSAALTALGAGESLTAFSISAAICAITALWPVLYILSRATPAGESGVSI